MKLTIQHKEQHTLELLDNGQWKAIVTPAPWNKRYENLRAAYESSYGPKGSAGDPFKHGKPEDFSEEIVWIISMANSISYVANDLGTAIKFVENFDKATETID